MALEKLRVSVGMNPPILLIDYSHQQSLTGTAVVRVEAPSSMKSHAPIDLVTLINIGHSMSSPTDETPSRLDLLKNAMKFVIRQLDNDDRLAIVAFNDQVVKESTTGILEISGGGRMAIEKKVDGLVAKGESTAFKPSLEYAVKILDDRADKKRVGFIVLISDGVDSKFKWSEESIAPTDAVRALLHKYPVHCFGLGKAHDPPALHYIAKTSYGTYSSITADELDGSNGSKITEALAVTVAGLKTVVAVDACVNIWSSSLYITRIDAGGYTRRGGSGGVLLGALCAGEVKDLVIYFSYRTGSWARGYHAALNGIAASATYRDGPGRQPSSTDTSSVSLPIHVADSPTPPANPCPPHPVVLRQLVRSKVVDLLTGLLKEFLALKAEAAGAVVGHGGKCKDGCDPVFQAVAASSLQRKWKEFKQSDESWKDAPRSFLDLGSIDADISAMVAALNRALGVGCVYSWMSSYQMQRPTATGLPAVASAGFRTPAMEAVVEEVRRQVAKEASARDAGMSVAVCKRAVDLLDAINRRFEVWHKLDHDLPPASRSLQQEDEGDESRSLSAALRGDISRARQHDIYLASDHAIKQWRSFLASVEKTHGHDHEAHNK